MQNYKLVIAYDGRKYIGWQRQVTQPHKTIQGKLEHVLSLLFEEPIQLIGSGRTDAGVHALGQVANFHASKTLELATITDYLKTYLPQDISIIQLSTASSRFHARYNCLRKTYTYTIDLNNFPNPFMRHYSYHISEPLCIESMKEASTYLIGTHDFTSFTSMKSKKKSPIKTIDAITFSHENHLLTLTFTGNGFLQHMVRILTGTLIEVGLKKIPPSQLPIILEGKSRALAGPTAPSHGLCLKKVYYD